jgi:Ni/Co efflux regulator RcnB
MKFVRYLLPTLLLSVMPLAAASAIPAAPAQGFNEAATVPVIQIQNRTHAQPRRHAQPRGHAQPRRHSQPRRHAHPAPRVHRHRYAPGRHYRTAPRGWHRYSARPRNWRTRGCIIVGPLWFCP